MNTREFVRKLRRSTNERIEVKKHESKGSHRRIYVGDRNTTIPWTKDLKKGLIRALLKQLHVDVRDFENP